MPQLMEQTKEMLSFEVAPEVQEKIRQAQDLHELIPEERVRDLERVDVSGRPYRYVKRSMDLIIALMALAVLLLPMLVIALVVVLDDPGGDLAVRLWPSGDLPPIRAGHCSRTALVPDHAVLGVPDGVAPVPLVRPSSPRQWGGGAGHLRCGRPWRDGPAQHLHGVEGLSVPDLFLAGL